MTGDTTICEDEGHTWDICCDSCNRLVCIECDVDYED